MAVSPRSAKTNPAPLKVHEHYSESGRWGSLVSNSPYFSETLASLPEEAFKGRVIAITGCTTGIGFHIARAATLRGARGVLLLNRPSQRSVACEQALRKVAPIGTEVQSIDCDLISFDSVVAAATSVETKVRELKGSVGGGLDVLVNNAAVAWQLDERTENCLEIQMQTNHISHVLLVNLLLPSLEESSDDSALNAGNTRERDTRSIKFRRADSNVTDDSHNTDVKRHDGFGRIVWAGGLAVFSPALPLTADYFAPSKAGGLGASKTALEATLKPESSLRKPFGANHRGAMGSLKRTFYFTSDEEFEGSHIRYHMSKLACAAFALGLSSQLAESGSRVKSVMYDPGVSESRLAINAEMKRHKNVAAKSLLSRFMPCSGFANKMTFDDAKSSCFGVQSPADGAASALMAAFAPDVNSGDVFAPSQSVSAREASFSKSMVGGKYGKRNIVNGKGHPVRIIEAGSRNTIANVEPLPFLFALDDANQTVCWNMSLQVIGITDFFIPRSISSPFIHARTSDTASAETRES